MVQRHVTGLAIRSLTHSDFTREPLHVLCWIIRPIMQNILECECHPPTACLVFFFFFFFLFLFFCFRDRNRESKHHPQLWIPIIHHPTGN